MLGNVLLGLSGGGLVVLVAARFRRHARLHHRRANKTFMAGYRAALRHLDARNSHCGRTR